MDDEDDTQRHTDIGFRSRSVDADRSDAMPVFFGPSTVHPRHDADLRLPPSPPVSHLAGYDAHDPARTAGWPATPFPPAPDPALARTSSAGPGPTPRGRDRPDRHIVVPLLLVVALAAVSAWGFTEHQSAGRWRQRHAQAAEVVRETQIALSGAEADLHETEGTLLETEGTLADERDLSAQLGDEKTDLADQRTQLADLLATAPAVTDALRICNDAMNDAVLAALDVATELVGTSYVSFAALDSAIERATEDCGTAQLLAGDLETGISDLGL